jgi:hypothetical protein
MIVGARWWKSLGYYGDGILFAELSISNLRIQQGRQGEFSAGRFTVWPWLFT